MLIKIAQKLDLFSHTIGFSYLVFHTEYVVTIYPHLLVFKSLVSNKKFEVNLDIDGTVEKFTVFHNLHKGYIEVRGVSSKGFFAYQIIEENKKIKIKFVRGKKKKDILLPIKKIFSKEPIEELSFGMHKKLDLEMINRREDLKEIFPILFKLSQYIDHAEKIEIGTASLLKDLEKSIKKHKVVELEKQFEIFYKASFSKYFVPRLSDEHQGIIKDRKIEKKNSLYILYQIGRLIRSMFVLEDKKSIFILPTLLPSFHCGRMINIETSYGKIDLEWSKKLIRRMKIDVKKDATIKLNLQSKIKSFRVKTLHIDMGKIYKSDDFISMKEGLTYFFDNFKK